MTVETVTPPRLTALVSTLSSDAHTWNLVYLQLLLEELGCRVTNLGACTPDETILAACLARRPDLVVVSSLNGHGCRDGLRLIEAIRARPALAALPVVIGGKLDVAGGARGTESRLLAAGFDAVFVDSGSFAGYVHRLASRAGRPIGAR